MGSLIIFIKSENDGYDWNMATILNLLNNWNKLEDTEPQNGKKMKYVTIFAYNRVMVWNRINFTKSSVYIFINNFKKFLKNSVS